MPFAPSEMSMWDKPIRLHHPKMSDEDISEKYELREQRIVTETNREKLPNFVEALKRPKYMNVQPFYQRRKRWDAVRQSRLIESFVINIPVPPLFVYETEFNTYEVMDGQQRITAIQSFYGNEFALKGLERWPELNGRRYSELPSKIRAGIDRRSISYVVLLAESAHTEEDALLLKQLVFERLNTGGVKLTQQEIRNCMYQGPLNDLLLELVKSDSFRAAWGLPRQTEDEGSDAGLLDKAFYAKLEDVEVALRFFALRHVDHYTRGMQGFLDLYMIRSQTFSDKDLEHLRSLFHRTLELGQEIYGDVLFHPFDPQQDDWHPRPQKAFCDAVLVGMSNYLDDGAILRNRRNAILNATRQLFREHEAGTFTGRGNTKADVTERINLFSNMLQTVRDA